MRQAHVQKGISPVMLITNSIEQKLLELQQAREQQARDKVWFANKPAPRKPDSPSDIINERIDNSPIRKRSKKEFKGYQNTFFFMVHHFDELNKLIPDRGDMSSQERAAKSEAILLDYKNKCNFLRTLDDDCLWRNLHKKFLANFWDLQREYNKKSQE